MSTTCEYNPVHNTLRNSALDDGSADVMLGKKAISCFGGPEAILGFLAWKNDDWEKGRRPFIVAAAAAAAAADDDDDDDNDVGDTRGRRRGCLEAEAQQRVESKGRE